MTDSSSPFRLLDLPYEIRSLIYLQYLYGLVIGHTWRKPSIPTINLRYLGRLQAIQSLLFSSKQLYHETWKAMWGNLQFQQSVSLSHESRESIILRVDKVFKLLSLAPRYTEIPVQTNVYASPSTGICHIILRAGQIGTYRLVDEEECVVMMLEWLQHFRYRIVDRDEYLRSGFWYEYS